MFDADQADALWLLQHHTPPSPRGHFHRPASVAAFGIEQPKTLIPVRRNTIGVKRSQRMAVFGGTPDLKLPKWSRLRQSSPLYVTAFWNHVYS